MAKRYLGGGVSFEQKDVYQEFSEDGGGGGGGGSTTLSGLTDVDISNPTDGQTLVYNANSGKWENGAGGVLVVTLDTNNNYLADKTCAEIMTAIEGAGVMFRAVYGPGVYDVLLLQRYGIYETDYAFIVGEYDPDSGRYPQVFLRGVGPDAYPKANNR